MLRLVPCREPLREQYLQLGLVGYGQWQVTDSGGVPGLLNGFHYRVAGIGPQVTLIVPKQNLSLAFRYEPEFSAKSRIQGSTMVLTGGITF